MRERGRERKREGRRENEREREKKREGETERGTRKEGGNEYVGKESRRERWKTRTFLLLSFPFYYQ